MQIVDLVKFKSKEGENSTSILKIVGWVTLAACMALLIIPATKVIIRILKICGEKTDHYTLDEFTSSKSKDQGKYLEKLSAGSSHAGDQ